MRALKGRTGKLSWSWVTWHHTSLCGIHPNAEEEECLGDKALVQPEFLLSFEVDPVEEVGTEAEKPVPMSFCFNCLDWIIPWGNTAEGGRGGEASPVTASWGSYAADAEKGHRGGRKPGRFPHIPKDSQEAGIIMQRHSPLIEMSPCPPALLWPGWQGICPWTRQTEDGICQTTTMGQVAAASPCLQCQDPEEGSLLLPCFCTTGPGRFPGEAWSELHISPAPGLLILAKPRGRGSSLQAALVRLSQTQTFCLSSPYTPGLGSAGVEDAIVHPHGLLTQCDVHPPDHSFLGAGIRPVPAEWPQLCVHQIPIPRVLSRSPFPRVCSIPPSPGSVLLLPHVPAHACLSIYTDTLSQPPPVTFLPPHPLRVTLCPLTRIQTRDTPQHAGSPTRSARSHSVPHHDQKTSLLTEQFFLVFGPFERWSVKCPAPPYPLPHAQSSGSPCAPRSLSRHPPCPSPAQRRAAPLRLAACKWLLLAITFSISDMSWWRIFNLDSYSCPNYRTYFWCCVFIPFRAGTLTPVLPPSRLC